MIVAVNVDQHRVDEERYQLKHFLQKKEGHNSFRLNFSFIITSDIPGTV